MPHISFDLRDMHCTSRARTGEMLVFTEPAFCNLQAWVLLGASLYAVPLRAERVFYLDTAIAPAQAANALDLGARVSRVKRTTPTGEAPPLLYQVQA